MEGPIKNLDLDKICRVCLIEKKDMHPLFGESLADMLMEFGQVHVDKTDGWPDKVCLQCVHQINRCHAFKQKVLKSDQQLRSYIKSLTVIVEEQMTPIQTIQAKDISAHIHASPITRQDLQTNNQTVAAPVLITSGQLQNAQIINAGQIVTTAHGQQIIQPQFATPTVAVQTGQFVQHGQFLHTGNGTVQVIPANSAPTQVVQIQQGDDRCEIILPGNIHTETEYYEEDQIEQLSHDDEEDEEEIEECTIEYEECQETEEVENPLDAYGISDDSECEDKEYIAEFISMQTSSLGPGRFVCNLCRREFKQVKWLTTHMKSHSNWIKANCKKLPKCEICQRSFKGPGMLRMHMKTHEKKPPAKAPVCGICNKEFKTKTILYRHRQRHFVKHMQCAVCLKYFSGVAQLQAHVSKHEGDKKFKCAHCGECFEQCDELKTHITTHNIKDLNIKVLEVTSR